MTVVGGQQRAEGRVPLLGAGSLGRSQLRRLALLLHGPDRRPGLRKTSPLHALAAKPLVGGSHEVAQARQVEPGGEPSGRLVLADDLVERRREGALREPSGLDLVEDAEARVHPGGHRVGREQPAAEAVDRGHPGSLAVPGGPCDLRGALRIPGLRGRPRPVGQLAADPFPKLAGGALGEREGQDRVHGDAVLRHGVAVALDEDARLARAGASLREHVAGPRVDRRHLLGREVVRRPQLEAGCGWAHHSPFPPLPPDSSVPIERSRRQIGW